MATDENVLDFKNTAQSGLPTNLIRPETPVVVEGYQMRHRLVMEGVNGLLNGLEALDSLECSDDEILEARARIVREFAASVWDAYYSSNEVQHGGIDPSDLFALDLRDAREYRLKRPEQNRIIQERKIPRLNTQGPKDAA